VLSAHAKRKRAFDAADAGFLTALANVVANSVRQIAAAQHRQLLVREMAHRAGNMLQLVSTLAHQTFLDGSDVASARAAFADRLGSLSRANYLVAKGGWSATRFRALAEEALEPFREHVEFIGRDVLLSPELCFDLGLILHELSTNSAKYGSLGVDGATVTLSWRIVPVAEGEGLAFAMEWLDARSEPSRGDGGGERRGFGTKLMRLLIERKWGGTIEPDAKQGYRFAFAIPLTDAALKAQD
jgi:two-component sensor histidine kinase